MKKDEKHNKKLTLYYRDGSTQVVHPTVQFDENWRALALMVSDGNYLKSKVQ